RAAEFAKLAVVDSGPCSACGADSPRIPVSVQVFKRRVVDPWTRRDTTGRKPGDVCPTCYCRMEKLWRVTAVSMLIGPLLLFAAFGGAAFLFLYPPGGVAALAIVVVCFVLLQVWVNRRYRRILGPLATELKSAVGISFWNPLSDRIIAVRRQDD
ncbi:MAG: hypothetical protein KDA61_09260, partial [Planctomycetales bacterium]|nr:hypothetical protein [Planctomycetales bacterium]